MGILKKILYFKLKLLAKAVIRKYQPQIIGITGSVGKTSAKEAIFTVVSEFKKTRRNVKNYNNEIGLPLTILAPSFSPGKNIFLWLKVFFKAFSLILFENKKYPKSLVLEMGADKPGDIRYLTEIAPPDIAVITAIGHSHQEFFGSFQNIVKEKLSLLKFVSGRDSWAILNQDDPEIAAAIANLKIPALTFGRNPKSDVLVSNIQIVKKGEIYGTTFKLHYQGTETPIFLPGVLGWQHAQAAAAAAAVGLALKMNMVSIGQALLKYKPALGRMAFLPGVKNSWIIDDTYNASPESAKAALEILMQVPIKGRHIAVFGDMLELGDYSEVGHQEVGRYLVDIGVDYLYIVGERSRDIARGALDAGMSEDKIYHFPFTREAGVFLQERLEPNDVVLIKGSRGSKMEQVVYEIMGRPWDANEKLVGPVDK